MSRTRILSWLTALLALLVLVPETQAQLFKPFAFPEVTSDFQFFAPHDIEMFGGGEPFRTGWFATFDRIYMNISRPEGSAAFNVSDRIGDWTWGNRFDLGFRDEDSKGWLFTGWHIDGPNRNDSLLTERLNRFNPNGAPQTPTVPPDHPHRDNNLRLTTDRDYLLQNSINVADLSSIELNRTWMMEPLFHGAKVEPFIGFRYTRFMDFFQRDNYERFDGTGTPVAPIPGWNVGAGIERLTSVRSAWVNDMVGGQLGIRWYKDYRHWEFSGDVKAMAFSNFQSFNSVTERETTFASVAANGADNVVTVAQERIAQGAGNISGEFVFGFEVRSEMAYYVTRDISVRVGFELLDFVRGMGRGNRFDQNEQDVLLYGVTFGATLNR